MDGNANYLYSCILHQHRSDDHSYYFPTRCDSIRSTTSPDLYTVRYLSMFVLFLYHTPPMCLFWKPIQIPAGGKLLWRPLGPSYSHTLSPRIHCEELRRAPVVGCTSIVYQPKCWKTIKSENKPWNCLFLRQQDDSSAAQSQVCSNILQPIP